MPQLMKSQAEQQNNQQQMVNSNQQINSSGDALLKGLLEISKLLTTSPMATYGQQGSQQQAKQQKPQLNPFNQGVEKALKDYGGSATIEALSKGVPPEHIMQQSGLLGPMGVNAVSQQGASNAANPQQVLASLLSTLQNNPQPQQQSMQQPMQQQQYQQQSPSQEQILIQNQLRELLAPKGFFGRFMEGAAKGAGGITTEDRLNNLAKAQEIAGLKPLQQGDREKLGIEAIKDLQLQNLKSLNDMSKQTQLTAKDLFDGFQKDSIPFVESRDGFNKMTAALTNSKTGKIDFSGMEGSDLDLLFGTAKTLDPSGKITDSDIAIQVLASGAFGDSFRAAANFFNKKGKLLPSQRKALYEAAVKRYKSTESMHERTVNGYKRLANENGVDPKVFIRDMGPGAKNTSNQITLGSGAIIRRIE